MFLNLKSFVSSNSFSIWIIIIWNHFCYGRNMRLILQVLNVKVLRRYPCCAFFNTSSPHKNHRSSKTLLARKKTDIIVSSIIQWDWPESANNWNANHKPQVIWEKISYLLLVWKMYVCMYVCMYVYVCVTGLKIWGIFLKMNMVLTSVRVSLELKLG